MTVETIPAPFASTPSHKMPAGACDVHTHIFGPFERFALQGEAIYALPEATPDRHREYRSALGFERAIAVQPAPYGADPAALLSAIANSYGALKGVAVTDDEASPLAEWASRGIVGLRFVESRTPDGKPYPGTVGLEALHRLAPAMRDAGLHAHIWGPLEILLEQLPELMRLRLPLVVDHMGTPNMGRSELEEDFARLLAMMDRGELWLKLTLCRLGRPDLGPSPDLKVLHDMAIAACPGRLLWGSDWPYVRMSPAPDAAKMLDVFFNWCGDPAIARQILVDNPAQLFGFEGELS